MDSLRVEGKVINMEWNAWKREKNYREMEEKQTIDIYSSHN